MLTTPIAYIIFNRPRHTRETFAAIRAQQPAKLFIIADGPRSGHPTDAQRCQEVREIVQKINWPCEVVRNYSDLNLGCKQRVITGLDWVFSQVECAIILEDDCLPHPDFYGYCEALLDRYKDDNHVMAVTGINFQDGRRRGKSAYYFSKYIHVWGWATWRKSWILNNPTLSFWPEWKRSVDWYKKMPNYFERNYWEQIFDRMYNNQIDTWDYSWVASVWNQGGLTATPNVNLVSNIGIGPDATHTVESEDRDGVMAHSLGPMIHPDKVVQNMEADRYVFNNHVSGANGRLYSRLISLVKLFLAKRMQSIVAYINS